MILAFLAVAWLIGLMLGFRLNVEPLPVFLLALASFPLGLMLRLTGRPVLPVVLVAVLLLGIWRVGVSESENSQLVTRDQQRVSVQGRIVSDPEPTARTTRFVLEVAGVNRGGGWQESSGRVQVYTDPPESMVVVREPPYFRRGDFLDLEGTLQKPEPIENFDYPSYLASQGIAGVFFAREVEWSREQSRRDWATGWVFDLRRQLSRSLEASLPQPHSSLAQALLLGLRGGLPEDVKEDFRSTGASHLLAISGMHVGILLAIALGGSAWAVGRRWQLYLVLPLAAIWVYGLISGLPVSVIRAALMGTLYLSALALGRPQSALPTLALSALVITAFEPLALKQISFQLSFAAMAGIIVALPYQARVTTAIQRGTTPTDPWWTLWAKYLGSWLAAGLIVSLGATLATLPLVAFNFDRIPLLGIPVTILALPSLPFVLAGSLLTALAGFVHPTLGQLVGVTVWVPLTYLLTLVSKTPGLTVSGHWVATPLVWAWYALLAGLLLAPRSLFYLRRVRGLLQLPINGVTASPGYLRPTARTLTCMGVAIVLLAVAVVLWVELLAGSDGKLHVYFFDVGQGDSALIVTPSGRQVLVDGGPDAESAALSLSEVMSPRDRSLDLVALTHLDADHSRGLLEVIDRYEVGAVLVGAEDKASPMYPQWQEQISRNQTKVIQMFAGRKLLLEDGVTLEALHPQSTAVVGSGSDRNNNGLVLRLTHGEIDFLLAADIESPAERHLVFSQTNLESEVLKVPHHGSNTSATPDFLERVNPSVAIISAGSDNRFGHPHPDVIARLEQALGNGAIYQTGEHGTIELISDGKSLWVKTAG